MKQLLSHRNCERIIELFLKRLFHLSSPNLLPKARHKHCFWAKNQTLPGLSPRLANYRSSDIQQLTNQIAVFALDH